MDIKEVQGKIKEVESNIREKIGNCKQLIDKLRNDYAKSDNLKTFVTQAVTEEILNKKERIPATIVTVWLLLVMIFSYDWTFGMNWAYVFNLGVLPFGVYYIVRSINEAPTN